MWKHWPAAGLFKFVSPSSGYQALKRSCLDVAKGHTHLNKPAAFSCWFVQVRMSFCYHLALKA